MILKLTSCAILIIHLQFSGYCQGTLSTSMVRLFEDNDFINIEFSGTDKAYTHGFRLDLLSVKEDEKFRFAEQLMLKSGPRSVNTFGWSLMQMMVTPGNLSNPEIEPSDYRYACSLSFLRTCHSTNAAKKYNLQTEYVLGVLGPIALGKETQLTMHRLINDEIPRGWDTQFRTSLLLNVNLAAEKQLLGVGRNIEYIGGAKTFIGTSLTGLSLYNLIRIGKMAPYFEGYLTRYLSQRKEKEMWQLYVIISPSLDVVCRNALVQGGIFEAEIDKTNSASPSSELRKRINPIGYSLTYGFVFTLRKISVAFTQRDLYAMIKEQTRHEVGNISIHIAL